MMLNFAGVGNLHCINYNRLWLCTRAWVHLKCQIVPIPILLHHEQHFSLSANRMKPFQRSYNWWMSRSHVFDVIEHRLPVLVWFKILLQKFDLCRRHFWWCCHIWYIVRRCLFAPLSSTFLHWKFRFNSVERIRLYAVFHVYTTCMLAAVGWALLKALVCWVCFCIFGSLTSCRPDVKSCACKTYLWVNEKAPWKMYRARWCYKSHCQGLLQLAISLLSHRKPMQNHSL